MTSKAVSEGPVRSLRFVVRSIAIAAVLIANFAWASQSTQSLSVADARLSRVITAFNNASTGKSGKDGYERAIAEAQKIKNEYGSSPAARIAQYYIALSEENLGHTAKAVENLQELIQSDDATMKALAQFALAALYKNHGENQKAVELFEQLDAQGAYTVHSGSRSKGESSDSTTKPHH